MRLGWVPVLPSLPDGQLPRDRAVSVSPHCSRVCPLQPGFPNARPWTDCISTPQAHLLKLQVPQLSCLTLSVGACKVGSKIRLLASASNLNGQPGSGTLCPLPCQWGVEKRTGGDKAFAWALACRQLAFCHLGWLQVHQTPGLRETLSEDAFNS